VGSARVSRELDAYRMLERLVQDGGGGVAANGAAIVAGQPLLPGDGALALPPAAATSVAPESVLRRRRSQRAYGSGGLPQAQIATILAAGAAGDARFGGAQRDGGVRVDFGVLALAIEDLEPLLYRYVADEHVLLAGAPLPDADGFSDLVLQPEYGSAAAIVIAFGDLEAAAARDGAAGHRRLLVRAGASLHAAWLTAVALGLAGSVFAGLLPAAVRDLAQGDGLRCAQLLALAVGPPAT
jgi:hypothetical protein